MEDTSPGLRQRFSLRKARPHPAEAGHGTDSIQGSAARKKRPALEYSHWNRAGLTVYLLYLCSAVAYFTVRATQVPWMESHFWYGILVLAAEAIGALAVTLYGLCIIRVPQQSLEAGKGAQKLQFHIHILVPCYSEALDIVAETVWAACQAELPNGCSSIVWLLDDGCDATKQAWAEGMAHEKIRYVTGRKRAKSEVNGKAENLNHLLRQLYKRPGEVPTTDLVAIFDCDQVCQRDFFLQTLPLLGVSDDVAMVVTPQQFGNVTPAADIFNHTNRHFWEVMVPGLVAWGMVVCTGSNLIIRADALESVGFFPGHTITEDFALGLELSKRGYRAAYLGQYLARGEAPEEGAIFRQRSRWCKGHLQAFMSRECPLNQPQLCWLLRLLFFSGTWSYLTAAFCTPLFTVVPFVAVAFRVYPTLLVPHFVYAFIPYFILMQSVMYFCNSLDLLRALWFSSCATQILWYTYLKAVWNTCLYVAGLKKKGRFKTTVKTGVNAAAADHAFGGMAPGTPHMLSRTVTPSSIPTLFTEVADSFIAPRHRSGTSEPCLLSSTLITALQRTVRTSASGLISLTADGSMASQRKPASQKTADEGEQARGSLTAAEEEGIASSGLCRTMTMPALQSQMSGGTRPGWNLQIASSECPDSPVSNASNCSAVRQIRFERLKVKNISFGVLRDTWVPLVTLMLSTWTILAGLQDLRSDGHRKAATALSVLWALYNCIGPYLLVHYTWFGRGSSLQRASTAAIILSVSVLIVAAVITWGLTPAQYDYRQVLGLSYRFLETQRSGSLPVTNRILWRGDSALLDRAPNGESLVGGWYDAGDHLKTSFSTAVAASFLAWGMLEFSKGHVAAGQLEVGHDNLRWASEYLMACHTGPHEFIGQVGHMETDHNFWGRPEDLDALNVSRPAYLINATHPGSDMAAQAAAALAATSQVFKQIDPEFASQALKHAAELYQFATTWTGSFAVSVPEMGKVYPSSAWRDDVAWAAAWLHMATAEPHYLEQARAWLEESRRIESHRWQYYVVNWDNMVWCTHALLSSQAAVSESTAAVSDFLDRWRRGQVVRYTPRGLAYSDDWGTLRNAANSAMLAFVHAKTLPYSQARMYACWAESQIRYMLGDGRHSYVVGYGRSPPLRPHHRAASCPRSTEACSSAHLHSASPNPHVLYGALVGGPQADDSYADNRLDHVKSEVGVEYNAGFTAALAGLVEFESSMTKCAQLSL